MGINIDQDTAEEAIFSVTELTGKHRFSSLKISANDMISR